MAKAARPAVPTLARGAAASAPTWRAAYSDRTAHLMALLSQFAYLPFENTPQITSQAPRPEKKGGRDALDRRLGPDFKLVAVFNRDDTQAYLAVSADFAVLAFRGTSSLGDWVTNLRAKRVPLKGAPVEVLVHEGFLSAFECCRAEIEAAVDKYVPADLGLYITGHSLGGALAQIASAALERDNLAACYTYGSPRVGTADFDRQVKCPHYRLINRSDLVPGVPPPSLGGYRHTGDPRLIKKGPVLLRRDRWPPALIALDLWALLVVLPLGRLFVIDDHMIWNYAAALKTIAKGRATPPSGAAAALVKAMTPKPKPPSPVRRREPA
ncbi:MAG: lipase family protein [Phenylobacterium sp.]|jgi:triacylglycerol lipase|nr:lipase family protein [Phenylobacterium sp.]